MAVVAEEALKYKKPLTVDPNAADHMDKAELYKDQKIAANGYLGLRNTTSKQPAAPETDVTSKADLYKEMKQVAAEQPDRPLDTPLANDNINPTPQASKETATHDKDGFLKAGSGNISAYSQDSSKPSTLQQTSADGTVTPALGSMTAEEMADYADWYRNTNMNRTLGWTNGYDAAMNTRSLANAIRQQMHANSQNWHTADQATKDYLHQQNLELEKLLQQHNGGAQSFYDASTGNWVTPNGNMGYGINVGQYKKGDIEDTYKAIYGMTDEEIAQYRNDVDRYYNFVDQSLARNQVDESSGFTGIYSQFVNGPYLQGLVNGSHGVNFDTWHDTQGDGFHDEVGITPKRDANGNIVKEAPYLKNNNGVDDYTAQFMSTINNGIINPSEHQISHAAGGYAVGKYNNGLVADGWGGGTGVQPAGDRGSGGSMGGSSSGGSQNDYINQMYSEALKAQLAQLESSYKQNISDLDASVGKVDNTYNEQKRQADGLSAQNAASWREMANAYGLNSGAIGQAALAQNNQNQIDINTLSAAQAQAQADIERQRTLLGQQYQLQINQAIAENNFQKAEMLYQEAVRSEEALRQQEQFNASMMQQYAQMAMQQQQYNTDLALQYAKMAGSGSSGGSGTPKQAEVIMPNVGTDEWYRYIRDQAAASGQTAEAYMDQNYKDLGIQSGDREKYLEQYLGLSPTALTSSWYNNGLGDARSLAAKYIAATGTRDGFDVATMLKDNGYSEDAVGLVLDSLGIK